MRRATIAVVEMLTPMPNAKTIVIIDSVKPTVAIASAPSRVTQKTLTMAKSDSINISSTMGVASSSTDLPMEPSVKSCFVPRMASSTEDQNPERGCDIAVAAIRTPLD